jgi:hypothetical protein
MPPLKQNKSLANVPAKRKQDVETQSPPQKRARLEDVAVTMTKQDLDSLDHEALVARVLALQEHVASLNKSTNLAPVFAPSPPKMTPEQLASKVDTARHMMIDGLKNQMKVCHPVASLTNSGNHLAKQTAPNSVIPPLSLTLPCSLLSSISPSTGRRNKSS